MEENIEVTGGEIKKLILDLTKKVEKIEGLNPETIKQVKENTKNIEEIKEKNTETKEMIEQKINTIKKDVDMLKASMRSRNLIFYNVSDSNNENNSELFLKITNILQDVKVDSRLVESVKRIGQKSSARPVVVTLMSQKFKKDIFDKAEYLKKKYNISIANDISKEERDEHNKLKKVDELILNGMN